MTRRQALGTRRMLADVAMSSECSSVDCTKGARQGSTFCVTHGGGKKCSFEGCTTTQQNRGLCKAHGGYVQCHYAASGIVCTSRVYSRQRYCQEHLASIQPFTPPHPPPVDEVRDRQNRRYSLDICITSYSR